MTTWRIGVDIGGTFTDIVALGGDGSVHTKKISSSVQDYARAIAEGLAELFVELDIRAGDVAELRHGTTIASNAILEHKGARTGLITTKGFRDVLEIRNLRMPRLYDIVWDKPPPLVERYLRVVVDERIDARGEVLAPLDAADAEAAVRRLLDEGVEAIAVCLLNSFLNPAHELLLKETIERLAPGIAHSISCEVLPEIKEYERTSTTVINAYVMPVVATYLAALRRYLREAGMRAPLLLMQSSGGLMTAEAAAGKPMHIIESGPAGGVVGSHAVAARMGFADLVSFDMGGTTAKASLIENGAYTRALEYQVGAGIMVGSRLLTGAGYMLKVPAIDLAEVGAGGGSHVWIDRGGALHVGPESAGAEPGPLCYAKGGTEPTLTDASLILGYLNPDYLVGGALRLEAGRAREIFADKVAGPLSLSLEDAAYGAHHIAASNMIRAIKAVSTERGRDPRGYALFAFGGNGPLFAAGMARELAMKRIVVPPSPGVFSSFGLLYAEVEHHFARSFRRLLRDLDLAALNAAWDAMVAEGRAQLAEEGFAGADAVCRREAALHYQGQTFDLVVPVPDGPLDGAAIAALAEAFGAEHERTYGHRAGSEEPVELVTIRVVATGRGSACKVPERPASHEAPAAPAPRRAYFGPQQGWLETPVVSRAELAGGRRGPLIVEEYDATCLVPPDAGATGDDFGNIVVTLA
jgi:N-methylhydantoinase A